ncbi:MAG TPA: hypothetical protein VF974_00750 [Patescibacteria group bacterium]
MFKHSLFFSGPGKCSRAKRWIRDNVDGIKDDDVSFDGNAFFFYTLLPFTEQRKQIISDALKPISFLSEEL